ncbi:MAG: NTP transferase domain-containing protein, partial [Vulcanimicrobiaceae bacterium]
MRFCAIVVAAGRGERFGAPKQFVPVAGRPLVAWSLETFGALAEIGDLVVATEGDLIDPMRELIARFAGRLVSRVVA